MYQTVLKKVTGTSAVGANGEKLEFIGHWPSQAGDTVWTDGKVIFGHIAPKESSVPIFSNNGIPISCEDSTGKDKKGYFTPSGTWKNYAVASEDWIVNNEKLLYGGSEKYNGAQIIDSEISNDGDIYIVTKGKCLYRTYFLTFDYTISAKLNNLYSYMLQEPRSGLIYHGQTWGFIYHFTPSDNIPLKIYKNGVLIKEIDLYDIVKKLQNEPDLVDALETLKKKSFISKDEWINETEIFEPGYESTGTDFTVYDGTGNWRVYEGNLYFKYDELEHMPNEPTIVYANVVVQTFTMSPDGNWEAIISANCYGYYFLSIVGRYFHRYNFGGLFYDVMDFPAVEWVAVPYGASFVYKLTNENDIETISKNIYGGLKVTTWALPLPYYLLWRAYTGNDLSDIPDVKKMEVDFSFASINQDLVDFLPVGDGFYKLNKSGKISFFDEEKNLLAEDLVVDDTYICVEIISFDSLKTNLNTGLHLKEKPVVKYKIYTPYEEHEEIFDMKTLNYNLANDNDLPFPLVNAQYTKKEDGTLEPFQFKPFLMKLKNDNYLFGVHGGKLYIKTPNGIQEVGDDLKNFRLAELNNMAKSKKANYTN